MGCRVVVTGDNTRRPDPTAALFQLVTCDLSSLRQHSGCRCSGTRVTQAR
jgi:hypothetical protein